MGSWCIMCLRLSVFFIYAFLKIKDNVCLIPCVGFLFVQAELFDKFLHGSTLEECYSAVASVANRWLDLLDVCKSLLALSIKTTSLKHCPYAPWGTSLSFCIIQACYKLHGQIKIEKEVCLKFHCFCFLLPSESRKGYCRQWVAWLYIRIKHNEQVFSGLWKPKVMCSDHCKTSGWFSWRYNGQR